MEDKNVLKLIKLIVITIGIIVIFLILNPFVIISAGKRGVVLNWGAVSDKVLGEGIHLRVPIQQKIIAMDVRTVKMEVEALAYSNDLQTVDAKIALNYHTNPNSANTLYQEIGKDYQERIISPSVQEVIKAVVANYKAQDLIEKREVVKEEIKGLLKERLGLKYLLVDEFSIINFDFSSEYEKAIESKQVAQQKALEAENILTRIKIEAEQKVAEAKGKAEALTIEGNALRATPQIVELRWIEKWNGQVPTYWGDATPFIGIK